MLGQNSEERAQGRKKKSRNANTVFLTYLYIRTSTLYTADNNFFVSHPQATDTGSRNAGSTDLT